MNNCRRVAQLDSLCLGESWLRLNPFAVAGSTPAAIATFSSSTVIYVLIIKSGVISLTLVTPVSAIATRISFSKIFSS